MKRWRGTKKGGAKVAVILAGHGAQWAANQSNWM